MKKQLKQLIPNNIDTNIINTRTKSNTHFNAKDGIVKQHKHDVVYKYVCPDINCDATYIGECGRRVGKRTIDHSGRDNKSHNIKHVFKKDHLWKGIQAS